MATLGEAVLKITANAQGLIGGLNKASAKMKAFGKKVGDAGKAIAGAGMKIAAFGAAILGAFLPAIVQGAKFEKSMSDVAAVVGDVFDSAGEGEGGKTLRNFDMLEQKAMELGETTEWSASQVAEAMKFMGMAGMSTMQINEGVAGVLELASAGSLDLARAADIATDSMSAFNLRAADLGRVNDVMAATAANANTSIDMMGESFKYVAPLASGLGQSIESVSTMLGLLANKGIKASSAGTSLNQAMATLATPTDKLTEVLQKNGLTFDQVNSSQNDMILVIKRLRDAGMTAGDMIAAFGKRGGRAILSLVQTSQEEFDKLSDSITNSFGEAAKQAAIKLDNMAGDFKKFWSAVEGVNIQVFKQLNVAMRPITQWLTAVIQQVAVWIKENKELAGTLLRITAGIGALAVVIGSVVMAVGGLVTAAGLFIAFKAQILSVMAAGVAAIFSFKTAIIVAITVVIIPIILALMATWTEFKVALLAAWTNVIQPVFEGFATGAKMLMAAVKPVWDYLVDALKLLWRTFEDMAKSLAPFREVIKSLAVAFAGMSLAPLAAVIAAVTAAVILLVKGLESLVDSARRVADMFSGNFTRAFESTQERFKRLKAETADFVAKQKALANAIMATTKEYDKHGKIVSNYTSGMRKMAGSLERFNDLTPLELENLKKLQEGYAKKDKLFERNTKNIAEAIAHHKDVISKLGDNAEAVSIVRIRLEMLQKAEASIIADRERQKEAIKKLIEEYGSLEEAYRQMAIKAEENKIKQDALIKSNEVQTENVSKLVKLKEDLLEANQPLLEGYAKEVFSLHELASAQRQLVETELEALQLAREHGPQDEKIIEGIDRKIAANQRLIVEIDRVRDANIERIRVEQDEDIAAYGQSQDFKLKKQEITIARQNKNIRHAIKLEQELRLAQIEAERQAELKKIEELFSGRISAAREEYAQLRQMRVAEINADTMLTDQQKQDQINNVNSVHNARMKVLDEWEQRNAANKQKAIDNANEVAHNDRQIAVNQSNIDRTNLEEQEAREEEADKKKIKREKEKAAAKKGGVRAAKEEQAAEETVLQAMIKQSKSVRQLAALRRMMYQERMQNQKKLEEQVTTVSKAEKRVLELKERLANAGSDAERRRLQNQLNSAEDKLRFEKARQEKFEDDAGVDIPDAEGGLADLQALQTQIDNLALALQRSFDIVGGLFTASPTKWVTTFIEGWVAAFPDILMQINTDLSSLHVSFESSFNGMKTVFSNFVQALTSNVVSMEQAAQRALSAAKKYKEAMDMMGDGGGGSGGGGSGPGGSGGI